MKRSFILIVLSVISLSLLSAQTTAEWRYEQKDNGDGTIDLIFRADIEKPWYMYNTDVVDNGPLPTTFEFKNIRGFEPVGKLRDLAKAKPKMDEAFGIEVMVYEESASFVQTIRRTTAEGFIVEGLLTFQTCNGSACIMDELDVSFKVGESASPVPPPAKKNSDGLFIFLLIAFAAGLGGVFTPCVFPMIPMTVSFFIGGTGNKRAGIIKGIIFGLSVTAIYTLVGVVVALFQSTDATDFMGTHWIPNLAFALLFLTFAASFFGAFEITLPSGLANRADARADKGGYLASFFVAFAMVIVSFSCTGPFVGSILAAAVTGGLALKPILGMFFFGFAFSLPFVLFSLFPSLMKKMPKSGGWLNVVKVVFAFILLAFSVKFLAAVDTWFGLGIINRAIFISVWIVVAILLGVYLLGKISTPHDTKVESVGVARILFATASFAFAVYLVPGLFGAPLASLSGLIPPVDRSTAIFSASVGSSGQTETFQGVSTGLCGPARFATEKNRAPHGLNSYYHIEDAINCAIEQNKPLLLSFKAVTCSACKVMEATVWSEPDVLELLNNNVVLVTLFVDDRTELPAEEQIVSSLDGKIKNTVGRKYRDYQLSRFGVASQPYYVLIDHRQQLLTEPVAECSKERFLSFLQSGIEAFNDGKTL